MTLAAEKPDVLERLGGAMSSSDLSPVEGRIGAVELIAALAFVQVNPDGKAHEGLDVAVVDPRTELAAVLVRLKYAGDRTLGDRAVHLLVHWVRHQKAFARWRVHPGQVTVLESFVRQSLAEWMYPVCQVCQGRELLGMDRGEVVERRVRCTKCKTQGWLVEKSQRSKLEVRVDCRVCSGRGWKVVQKVRQEKARACDGCSGTGRQRANDAERAMALGIEHRVYQRHWQRRFDWLAAGLDRLDHLVKRCLQSQMRFNTVAP